MCACECVNDSKQTNQMDSELINVIFLGLGFLFLYSATQTSFFIQAIVVASVNDEYRDAWNGKEWNAYGALGVYYFVFAFSGFIAPAIIAKTGPKLSLIVSAISLWLVNFVFIFPFYPGLILSSIFSGFGSAVLWTAEGSFLALNSNKHTIDRNTSIFWILFSSNLVVGNIFVMYEFAGEEYIQPHTRIVTYSMLTVCATIGCIMMFFLRDVKPSEELEIPNISPWQAFKSAFKLLKTKQMLFFSVLFLYLGVVVMFYSSIYSTAIGFTKAFGKDRKKYSGESGILLGAGEILGAVIAMRVSARSSKPRSHGSILVLIGYTLQMFAFVTVYFNLPAAASLRETDDLALMPTNLILGLLVSFLLGLGDAFIEIQAIALLSMLYQDKSASAFAIFTFVQSIVSAGGFFYSNYVDLHVHACLLVVTATIGILAMLKIYSMNPDEPGSQKTIKKRDIDENQNEQTVDFSLRSLKC
ncbi:UNC93-like protein MFSD11 [Brevipalpus obovatus]|uniref:UNC93-like protein MFSD11 n=1 Tax=Brevipalpus obovatus TaxID=246614 RepID=UPI003D9F84C7